MKRQIPQARFDETEADWLVADYGVKPSVEKRREIRTFLRSQKEQFLAPERNRDNERESRSL